MNAYNVVSSVAFVKVQGKNGKNLHQNVNKMPLHNI